MTEAMSETSAPLICHECWAKKVNHYGSCEHVLQVIAEATMKEHKRAARDRALLAPFRELMFEIAPTVEFYLKREIESPSNHQEFAREAQERLDKFRVYVSLFKPNLL